MKIYAITKKEERKKGHNIYDIYMYDISGY